MRYLTRLPSAPSRALARSAATAAAATSTAPASATASKPASPPSPLRTASAPAAASSKSSSAAAASTGAKTSGNAKVSAAEKKGKRKLAQKKPSRTRRPEISLERPRGWNRPVYPGVIPAYDLALKLIREDAAKVGAEADDLRARLQKDEVAADRRAAEEKRLGILDVMSKINLPDVRWKAANGIVDMSVPVYRYLAEKRWREEGDLDLLMERLHQMHIIPDVLPDFHPSFDVRLRVPFKRTARARPVLKAVEPGKFLHSDQTLKPPKLYTTVFGTEPKLYTMMMVDPDVPDTENSTFTTFLHWLQPNISLPHSDPLSLEINNTHTGYVPPHPAQGSPYHRYLIVFLPQSGPIKPAPQKREGFSVRRFAEKYGLSFNGGGAHMFREIYDPSAANVWKHFIKKPMPRYGNAPRPDPIAELKTRPRYPPVSAPKYSFGATPVPTPSGAKTMGTAKAKAPRLLAH